MRQPYSVDRFSQWVAGLVFRERVVFEAQIREIIRQRERVEQGLSRLPGVTVFPSEANFVLFRVEHGAAVWRDLLHNHDVLVRDLSRAPGLEDCLRVSIGSEGENARFLEAMEEISKARRGAGSSSAANGQS